MTEITLIFPDQLFEDHPGLSEGRAVCLAEEFLFFKVQPFHKQRLVLLRAAMRAYAEKLKREKRQVIYIPSKDLNRRGELFSLLEKKGVKKIHVAEFADEWLSQDLQEAAEKWGWEVSFYPSPGFICRNQEIKTFFAGKQHYSMAQFYAYQRKRLDILMDGSGPLGGKYSFDTDNRKKIPKGLSIPGAFVASKSSQVEQIIDEVEQEFQHAIGDASSFNYPVTHEEARAALRDFLKNKMRLYGDYQDALQLGDSFLFHSVISPLLNIGLLTPMEVAESALEHARKNSVPLNSLEGFIRQIIGWREFVRASYFLKGSYQRSLNFFRHQEKIPKCFWNGSTQIVPLDAVIKRALQTGYSNHIERLMVLGNFLLLTETSPDEVYSWFMGNFVDAYDWVMVSNVYGMSQYADGGKIVTKPYISGSNYLLKMSNYPKGEWTEIWDGLFWRFLSVHRALFSSNLRTQNMVYLLNKNESSILPKIRKAELWLEDYRKR